MMPDISYAADPHGNSMVVLIPDGDTPRKLLQVAGLIFATLFLVYAYSAWHAREVPTQILGGNVKKNTFVPKPAVQLFVKPVARPLALGASPTDSGFVDPEIPIDAPVITFTTPTEADIGGRW